MHKLISIIFIHCFAISLMAQPNFIESYPDTLNKKRMYKVVGSEVGTYVAGLSFLSFIWYKDHERVDFHFYNDSKGYLQIDKAGHAYGAYRESYAAYYALRWCGIEKKKALLWGSSAGIIFQTPIEIFDGMYEGWGFSWSDMAANTFGSLMFFGQEALFDDQVFLMKFSYYPSIYPKYHPILGETFVENFFYDYNAHTYWLSGGLSRITGFHRIPEWLNISFGYSANGMIKEFDNPQYYQGTPIPELDRYRQYIFSLDINFSKIPTNKKWLKTVFRAVNLIKIPFPGIEYNRIDGINFHPLYF